MRSSAPSISVALVITTLVAAGCSDEPPDTTGPLAERIGRCEPLEEGDSVERAPLESIVLDDDLTWVSVKLPGVSDEERFLFDFSLGGLRPDRSLSGSVTMGSTEADWIDDLLAEPEVSEVLLSLEVVPAGEGEEGPSYSTYGPAVAVTSTERVAFAGDCLEAWTQQFTHYVLKQGLPPEREAAELRAIVAVLDGPEAKSFLDFLLPPPTSWTDLPPDSRP